MNEKIYRVLGQAGVTGITTGIIITIVGITVGVLSMVAGARALHSRKGMMI